MEDFHGSAFMVECCIGSVRQKMNEQRSVEGSAPVPARPHKHAHKTVPRIPVVPDGRLRGNLRGHLLVKAGEGLHRILEPAIATHEP